MIDCKEFYDFLIQQELIFFTGVPDSLLKEFCNYITDNTDSKNNIISANEGGAIALATGYNLATNKIGIVYMQNSGQGNCVNPLTSLTDPKVYSIPMLLLIGWRGRLGEHDEPQHIKQGEITLELLKTLGIDYDILSNFLDEAKNDVRKAIKSIKKNSSPYALIINKKTFKQYNLKKEVKNFYELKRKDAIKLVIDNLEPSDVIISTTGKTSRELFEYRKELNQSHEKDFLTVGSMGHCSQIALGIALNKINKQIYCLDGDGSIIMHLGSLAIIGQQSPENFKHIVFNNGAHDSVGGQPTAGFDMNIAELAKNCNYNFVLKAETKNEINKNMKILKKNKGPGMLEIRINKGSKKDLERPKNRPKKNKKDFMKFLLK